MSTHLHHSSWLRLGLLLLALLAVPLQAAYQNFESSHVHPLALHPSGKVLLALNTPDAGVEVFVVRGDGSLRPFTFLPTGLEPVSIVPRNDDEVWVVNHLSDSISILSAAEMAVVRTLHVGDEPTDVAFARNKAFVAVSGEDLVRVYDLSDLSAPPVDVPIFSKKPRALAVSRDGNTVYVVAQNSGNQTTVLNATAISRNPANEFDPVRLSELNRTDMTCDGPANPYPPLPDGIERNPSLDDPRSGIPEIGLIVRWDESRDAWVDDAGQDWTHCLPYRLPDHDLFSIRASTLRVETWDHLGTNLFDVAVRPGTGHIYVPHTEARNFVRFEHANGVQGHIVDNRLAIVNPGNDSVVHVDLNGHVDRESTPPENLPERAASISQPGQLIWNETGSRGYLTGLGSGKVFEVAGACQTPQCIFGPDRRNPRAVDVGDGPSGLALREDLDRLYVLNRFSNSISIVRASTMQLLEEIPLHDPTPTPTKDGRRFLYDAVLSSAHGDAACSSCHISGDTDGLAWDLGNPEDDMVPYTRERDNVRFIQRRRPDFDCNPEHDPDCSSHQGFDPHKGPMTTQTLRAMLEPLHWRGDRATMREFNGAFVSLLGAENQGSDQAPAGLAAHEMDLFREFALAIQFPPNPHRKLNDTLPDEGVQIPGTDFVGNPTQGAIDYQTVRSDSGNPCSGCHQLPFGTHSGVLGGLEPSEPTSSRAAALVDGQPDRSFHSDMKIPHLRNIYTKLGPLHGNHGEDAPEAKTGFGLSHDGSVADPLQFLSVAVFALTSQQVRDISSFLLHFATGTKPCVGQQVTLNPGEPPTGSAEEEAILDTLLSIADAGNAFRHGELIASANGPGGLRYLRYIDGEWQTDSKQDPRISTEMLRTLAFGPITFTCVPKGDGIRLGHDRDGDGVPNADDCADDDPTVSCLTSGLDGPLELWRTFPEREQKIELGSR